MSPTNPLPEVTYVVDTVGHKRKRLFLGRNVALEQPSILPTAHWLPHTQAVHSTLDRSPVFPPCLPVAQDRRLQTSEVPRLRILSRSRQPTPVRTPECTQSDSNPELLRPRALELPLQTMGAAINALLGSTEVRALTHPHLPAVALHTELEPLNVMDILVERFPNNVLSLRPKAVPVSSALQAAWQPLASLSRVIGPPVLHASPLLHALLVRWIGNIVEGAPQTTFVSKPAPPALTSQVPPALRNPLRTLIPKKASEARLILTPAWTPRCILEGPASHSLLVPPLPKRVALRTQLTTEQQWKWPSLLLKARPK